MNTKNQQREKYTALAHAGKLTGTIAEAVRKWEARQTNKPQPYTSRTLQLKERRAKPVVVPLGDYGTPILDEYRKGDRRVLWSDVEPMR